MKRFVTILLLATSAAWAGLPPTTSKVSGDSNPVTTFNYQFPNFTGTHTGTSIALGVNAVSGGGTGKSSYTTKSIPYFDGSILNEDTANLTYDSAGKLLTAPLTLSLHGASPSTAVVGHDGANNSGVDYCGSSGGQSQGGCFEAWGTSAGGGDGGWLYALLGTGTSGFAVYDHTITNDRFHVTDAGAVQFGAFGAGVAHLDASGNLSSSTIASGDIAAGAVTNAKLANMAANTIKGNNTGSPAAPADLTGTQATALLDAFTGDSGSGGVKGLVPAPASGDGAQGKVLQANGTWGFPSAAGGGLNLLTTSDNPGFELGSTSGWTASGGTFAVTATSPIFGGYKATWTASASSQTLSSASKAIPIGLQGQNCLAAFSYIYSGTSGDYSAQIYDGSVVKYTYSIPQATSMTEVPLNFQCPSSGNISFRLISNVASPGQISLDGFDNAGGVIHLGSALNLGTAQQITAWKDNTSAYTFAASFGTLTNVKVYERRNGDMLEVSGSYTGGSPTASTAYIQLPSGYTIDSAKVSSAGANLGHFVVGQGTSTNLYASSSASVFYDGSTTNQVFIANTVTSTGFVKANANSISNNTVPQFFKFSVPIAGWSAGTIATVNTTAQSWSGFINGATWSTTSASFTDPTVSGTPAITQRTNNNFPSVSLASSNRPGWTFTPNKLGNIFVCVNVAIPNGGTGDQEVLRLYDGANVLVTSQGEIASYPTAVMLCGVENVTSLNPVTLSVQLAQNGTTTARIGAPNSLANALEITMIDISQNFPQPQFVGSVSSNTSGQERIERAYITNNGTTAAISTQSGSWLSSATRNSVGKVTLAIASGEFSATPQCTCILVGADASFTGNACIIASDSTMSSTSLTFTTGDNSTPHKDVNFNVICMGPK